MENTELKDLGERALPPHRLQGWGVVHLYQLAGCRPVGDKQPGETLFWTPGYTVSFISLPTWAPQMAVTRQAARSECVWKGGGESAGARASSVFILLKTSPGNRARARGTGREFIFDQALHAGASAESPQGTGSTHPLRSPPSTTKVGVLGRTEENCAGERGLFPPERISLPVLPLPQAVSAPHGLGLIVKAEKRAAGKPGLGPQLWVLSVLRPRTTSWW